MALVTVSILLCSGQTLFRVVGMDRSIMRFDMDVDGDGETLTVDEMVGKCSSTGTLNLFLQSQRVGQRPKGILFLWYDGDRCVVGGLMCAFLGVCDSRCVARTSDPVKRRVRVRGSIGVVLGWLLCVVVVLGVRCLRCGTR